MAELKDFQKRVVVEKDDLKEKVLKLNEFIGTNPVFDTLPEDEQKDMADQLLHMTGYLSCLERRINRF